MTDTTTRPSACALPPTGNVALLLNEIGHALDRLIEAGESTTIDLGAIPMTPQEAVELDEALGQGEVAATLEADGHSDILETSFPGVWRITLRSTGGAVMARHVEITRIPEILLSQDIDMVAGRRRLAQQIETLKPDGLAPEAQGAGMTTEGGAP